MKILSIDTSSSNASVSILEDENVLIELNNSDEKTHSQKLMPMIDDAFKKANLSLDDINLISCGIGPGSFTGVRIGIATAKAFIDSKHIPAVGVSSLEALAYNLNKEGYICSIINANHDNVYAGFFNIESKNEVLQTIKQSYAFLDLKNKDGKLTLENLVSFIKENISNNSLDFPIYFVGDATIIYKNLLEDLKITECKNIIASENEAICSSITIAKVGYTKYKNGNFGDSTILSPLYLRKSQAELTLLNK